MRGTKPKKLGSWKGRRGHAKRETGRQGKKHRPLGIRQSSQARPRPPPTPAQARGRARTRPQLSGVRRSRAASVSGRANHASLPAPLSLHPLTGACGRARGVPPLSGAEPRRAERVGQSGQSRVSSASRAAPPLGGDRLRPRLRAFSALEEGEGR